MKTYSEVEKWLVKHDIEDFTILDDLSIMIHRSVNLNGKLDSSELPVKFKSVNGYFDISNNELTSLKGCPKAVGKDFNCSNNRLDSLIGCPKKVGDFDCSNNLLKSLTYAPKEVVGFFNCSRNKIISLNGSPRTIKGYYNCSYNQVESLTGAPQYIGSYFDCSNNYVKELKGGPISVEQDYICNRNFLIDLDGIADIVGWNVLTDVLLNKIKDSFYNEEGKYWKYKGKEVVKHVYKVLISFTKKEDIKHWIKEHRIDNATILDDLSINVRGNVYLSDSLVNLSNLPVSFNEVHGNFDISNNELTSLKGCPKIIHGNFLALKNELTSLKGGPRQVNGNYIILKNNINSLKYSPLIVKEDFICSHNPLKELDGINKVGGSVFTNILLSNLKSKKYIYNSIPTYKYQGQDIVEHLEKVYVKLTEEEKVFEKTKINLKNVITRLIKTDSLKEDMINDILIKNLEKYHLTELKEKVLNIKKRAKKEFTENDVLRLAFEEEL